MASRPSPPQPDDTDDEELDPLDRVLDAFVAFTGRILRDTEREAMRGMLVSIVQELSETQTTSFVDHGRLADALYDSIEDAHAREIVMILGKGGVEGAELQGWLAKKLEEERATRRRR